MFFSYDWAEGAREIDRVSGIRRDERRRPDGLEADRMIARDAPRPMTCRIDTDAVGHSGRIDLVLHRSASPRIRFTMPRVEALLALVEHLLHEVSARTATTHAAAIRIAFMF